MKFVSAGRLAGLAGCLFLGVAWVAQAAEPRDPVLMFGEGNFPASDSLSYQFHDTPGHADGSPILTDHRENGQVILHKTATETWAVHERAGLFNVSAPVVIPQTNLSIPTELYSVEAGASYGRHLAKDRDFGLNFNVGSDSDRLFYTIHETIFQATASYRMPSGQNNAWLFFLNYSNNRHFFNNIPLPGFGYYFSALDDKLKAIVGFPFASALYTPNADWSLHAGLFGPRRLNAEIARRITGPVKLYGGFDWSPQEWERANRDNNSNRLFFDKKRLMVGVRLPAGQAGSPIFEDITLDASGGREFDRRFFENDSSSVKDVPYASLPAAWYFETRLAYRFGIQK